MRILDFIVSGQRIECDPGCDFSGIVSGTREYLMARFRFSSEWRGCKRVAVFSCRGKEYPTPLTNGLCIIPDKALIGTNVEVSVVGQSGTYRITTNSTSFTQEGCNHGNS